MRIALVAPSSDPFATHLDPRCAAEASRVISLARSLAAVGHRITIYARKDCDALPESAIAAPGVTIEHVPAGPAAPVKPEALTAHLPEFGNHLTQRWRRNRPDVAHAYSWTMGLAALAGARGLGIPVVQTFGSLGAAERRYGLQETPSDARFRLEACIARTADAVLASSAEEAADLARLGVPRAKIRVVPCGVDTGQFSPDGPAAERGGRLRLLAAEPLTEPDSLAITVQALADLPDAELVIMGGPDKAGLGKDKARQDLMRMAKTLRVADRLVFTGRVPEADLAALLRSADVLVSTAAYEPVGATMLQAMACGTPVVAPAAGAAQDAIVDATTGLLLPPGAPHPARLASVLRRLLANTLRLEAYGIGAADRAKSRYSWERITRETLTAYAGCVRRPPAAVKAKSAEPRHDAADSAREARKASEAAPAEEAREAMPAREARKASRGA
jgi:glycosyltransferase involved in cell wall biosynthesis